MVDVVGTASAVLALLGAADKAMTTFVDFARNVGSVNETVASFLREVENLFSLIRGIEKKLRELPADTMEESQLTGVWEPMTVTLTECRRTVADLTKLFRRVNDHATGGLIQQAMMQIKVQFKKETIAGLRQRIALLEQEIQMAMAAMTWVLVVRLDNRGVMEFKKIEAFFAQFEQKFDIMTQSIVQLRENDTSVQGLELGIRVMHESMFNAVRPVFKSASTAFEILSTAGSHIGEEEDVERSEGIHAWVEEVEEEEAPSAMVYLEPMESISWPEIKIGSWPPEIISDENVEIRSELIHRGVDAYHQGSYRVAYNRFKAAYDVGALEPRDVPGNAFSNETLKAWLWLSQLRVNAEDTKPTNLIPTNVPSRPKVNLAAIKIESRLQICVDALVISLAYMYDGDYTQAESLCGAALIGISNLEGKGSAAYDKGVLTMVELQYSRGPTEKAQSWRRRLVRDHLGALRETAEAFFPTQQNEQQQDVIAVPANDLHRGVKMKLRRAIKSANFNAALFTITHLEALGVNPRLLGLDIPMDLDPRLLIRDTLAPIYEEHYLENALRTDSLSIVALLLQHGMHIEIPSGVCCRFQILDPFLTLATRRSSAALAGMLIDAGANPDYRTPCTVQSREAMCYSLPSNVETSILALAVSLGCAEIFKLFLERGVGVNGLLSVRLSSTTIDFEPPLHVAIRCFAGRPLIPLLLEHGANVNHAFRDVRPLMLAIYHSGEGTGPNIRTVTRKDVVEQLINAGADVNRRSVIEGVRITPLQQARKYGLFSIECLLLAHGAVERKVTNRRKVRRKSTRRRVEENDSCSREFAHD